MRQKKRSKFLAVNTTLEDITISDEVLVSETMPGVYSNDFDRKIPRNVKLIITIFFDYITGFIYRASNRRPIAAFIWLFIGLYNIGWLLDIISVIKYGTYTHWASKKGRHIKKIMSDKLKRRKQFLEKIGESSVKGENNNK
jgi:hypothetical protein